MGEHVGPFIVSIIAIDNIASMRTAPKPARVELVASD